MYVATFYKFVSLDNYIDMKDVVYNKAVELDIKGTFLLGSEGINASIYQSRSKIEEFIGFLSTDRRFSGIKPFLNKTLKTPFKKMCVKLKAEIVRLGTDDIDMCTIGKHLNSYEWDDFIQNSKGYVIDTRNKYETCFGTFKGSVIPDVDNFRSFPDWLDCWIEHNSVSKNDNIAMCCTGGIRCDKTTSLLISKGYNNIFHLKGGIVQYLNDTQNKNNLWVGDCFVFDDRILIDDKLSDVSLFCQMCNSLMEAKDMKNITKGKLVCLNCRKNEK